MSNWSGGVLTSAGLDLQAKVEAGICTLDVTKIKLGDGAESMDAVASLTDLVSPKVELGVSSAIPEGAKCTITGVMTSTMLTAGFWCREWGLFANDPDLGEILFMITIDTQPEWLPPSSQTAQISATYAMNIAIANAENITVEIDLAGLVDVKMLHQYSKVDERDHTYYKGDILNDPGLKPGLVLEAKNDGKTSITYHDFSALNWGQTIADGTIVWAVKRYLVAEGDAMEIGLDGNWQPTNQFTYSQNWEIAPDGNLMPQSAI